MATTAQRAGEASKPIEVDDDENSLDEDQLMEYREELEMLGSFPVSRMFLCLFLKVIDASHRIGKG
jgi:hypothetical protein